MFKPQVETRTAGERFQCKVLNILTSFLWLIKAYTLSPFVYNSIEISIRLFSFTFLGKSRAREGENKLRHSRPFLMLP